MVPQYWLKSILVIALAAIATLTWIPAISSGEWPWQQSKKTYNGESIQSLKAQSLPLPGWRVQSHGTVNINGQPWGLGEYGRDTPGDINRFGLLLRPQPWHEDKPGVEWIDLQGAQRWQAAEPTTIRLNLDAQGVRARYFQARTEQQTLLVLQWYAWPGGGDFATSRWFWKNQLSQWQLGRHTPWIAVCLLIPINPLSNFQDHMNSAIQVGETVQTALAAKFPPADDSSLGHSS